MMVDTTVYGYVADGGVSCPDCYDPIDTGGEESASRIYSTDDTDPEGLSCEGCGNYIFEPSWSDLWEVAIQEAIQDGRSRNDGDWRTAARILSMLQDAGFEPEGQFPDR